MTIGITTYLIYLAISIALTIWVARTLHKNGRVFLSTSSMAMKPSLTRLITCSSSGFT